MTYPRKLHSTFFFEFIKGADRGKCWYPDSRYLSVQFFDDYRLYDTLFSKALPNFSYYGLTHVSRLEWEKLKIVAQETGGIERALILELEPWVESCYKTEDVFTIYGI